MRIICEKQVLVLQTSWIHLMDIKSVVWHYSCDGRFTNIVSFTRAVESGQILTLSYNGSWKNGQVLLLDWP